MMVQQDLNLIVGIPLVIVDEQLVLNMVVDEQLVLDMIADKQVVLYMIVVVEEVNRIVVVEESLKIIDGTQMDCIEADCCRMEERIWKSLPHHSNFISMDFMLPKICVQLIKVCVVHIL
ncbi:hypothetical protein Tco_1274289 [Tanacetum coccineum]